MEINSVDMSICETQQMIYELAVEQGYGMRTFLEQFLTSDFCRRAFDTIYSHYQFADAEENFDFLIPEISDKISKNQSETDVFAGDIGYMYRLLYIMTSVPSAELSTIIPYQEMYKRAFVFQHYGFEECAEEIIEFYGLPLKKYNSDSPLLTDEEMTEIERKYSGEFTESNQ